MEKQTVAVLGPGSWGTALAQVLNDNGHEVRIWGNIAEQITEINEHHTNKRYFKDIVLDEKITAYYDLKETLDGVDAILFVVPTKVTRLVAKQVAEVLDHPVKIMHASKGLENYLQIYEAKWLSYLDQAMLKKPSFVILLLSQQLQKT